MLFPEYPHYLPHPLILLLPLLKWMILIYPIQGKGREGKGAKQRKTHYEIMSIKNMKNDHLSKLHNVWDETGLLWELYGIHTYIGYIVIERYDTLHAGLRDALTHISCQSVAVASKYAEYMEIATVLRVINEARNSKNGRQTQELRKRDSTIHAHTYAKGETSGGRVE